MVGLILTMPSYSQPMYHEKLIELGKAYKNFMFRNQPPDDVIEDLKRKTPENLKTTLNFIIQTITTDNKLLSKEFLSVPDSNSLKLIYIIRSINFNIRLENQIDNNFLIDSLFQSDINRNELIDSYYSMLFSSVGNKIKPFDFSNIDFKMNDYNLKNDTEKGIFFLQTMDFCGRLIWGYMNIAKPVNTEKAYSFIQKFPKFNGLNYYQFTDLNFPDFEMTIIKEKGKQSYKNYYIDKYYEVLLANLTCLRKKEVDDNEINNLLLGSILKDNTLYKYTKHKEYLENMFKEIK